jgi:hypothetical protein
MDLKDNTHHVQIIIIMFFLGGWKENEVTLGAEIQVRVGVF